VAFGVDDFRDLLRLLEEHPEWRAELRRLVLTEELLALPAVVQELARRVADLAEAQQRTEAELSELRQAVAELRQAVAELRQGLAELRQTVAELAEAQRRAEDRLDRIDQRLADLRGDNLERRYWEHAGAYFDDVIRRAVLLSDQQLADLLDEPEAEGRLTHAERRDVLWADLVVRGRRRSDGAEVYLVVEVSAGLGAGDVERAARRATLLGRLRPSLAVVAGEWITPEAERMANVYGVWRVLDGRMVGPNGHGE
jgi:vacuolar-type H+-ATPase subunit I/STV1